jgi:phage replication-related protein YjqB (UPF0714/DUF867 family)
MGQRAEIEIKVTREQLAEIVAAAGPGGTIEDGISKLIERAGDNESGGAEWTKKN